jgi:integrase
VRCPVYSSGLGVVIVAMARVGHHQRQIRRLLVVSGNGHVTTRQLLRACYGSRKRRFTHPQRFAMMRAAARFIGEMHARRACGFTLANAGKDTRSLQAYLGHKNIQHTVKYTELAPQRFKGWWKD